MRTSDLFDFWPDDDFDKDSKDGLSRLPYKELLRRISLEPAQVLLGKIAFELISEECHLLDANILAARSAANIVVSVVGMKDLLWYRGVPIPPSEKGNALAWIKGQAHLAMGDLMIDDSEADRQGKEQATPSEPRHLYLKEWFGVPENRVLGSAVRFNSLQKIVRTCFFKVFVPELASVPRDSLARLSPEVVKRKAEIGLRAIIEPTGEMPNWPPSEFDEGAGNE